MPQIGTPSDETEGKIEPSKAIVRSVRLRSLGEGESVLGGTNGAEDVVLDFKTIVAGPGVTIESDVNTLTFSNAAQLEVDALELSLNQLSADFTSLQASFDEYVAQHLVTHNGIELELDSLSVLVDNATTAVANLDASVTAQITSINSSIATNASNISALDGRVVSLTSHVDTQVASLNTSITSLQTNLETQIDTLETSVNGQITTLSTDVGSRVLKAGDTMTGYLTLNGDPTNAMHAATKQYVDATTRLRINTQVGATVNYIITAADAQYTLLRIVSTNAATVTIPDDLTLNLPIGTAILVGQSGAGQVSFVAGSGVLINTPDTLKIARIHGKVTIIKVDANTWDLEGNLEAAL